jgi:hypothetical protein
MNSLRRTALNTLQTKGIFMTRLTSLAAAVFGLAIASPVAADETSRLASLSKSAFMDEYSQIFVQTLAVSTELMQRFDPVLGDKVVGVHPMTDAESDAMACTYDIMAEANELDALARQVTSFNLIEEMMAADLEFDFVTLTMDEDVQQRLTEGLPDSLFSAMVDCGTIAASQERMTLLPEFWEAFGAAAQERGYNQ